MAREQTGSQAWSGDRVMAERDGELSAAEMEQVAGGVAPPQLQLQTQIEPDKILVGLLLPAIQKVR